MCGAGCGHSFTVVVWAMECSEVFGPCSWSSLSGDDGKNARPMLDASASCKSVGGTAPVGAPLVWCLRAVVGSWPTVFSRAGSACETCSAPADLVSRSRVIGGSLARQRSAQRVILWCSWFAWKVLLWYRSGSSVSLCRGLATTESSSCRSDNASPGGTVLLLPVLSRSVLTWSCQRSSCAQGHCAAHKCALQAASQLGRAR